MYIFGAQIDEISTFYRFHCGIGYSKLVSRNRLVKAILLSLTLSGSLGDPVAGLGGLGRRKRERGPKPPLLLKPLGGWRNQPARARGGAGNW